MDELTQWKNRALEAEAEVERLGSTGHTAEECEAHLIQDEYEALAGDVRKVFRVRNDGGIVVDMRLLERDEVPYLFAAAEVKEEAL